MIFVAHKNDWHQLSLLLVRWRHRLVVIGERLVELLLKTPSNLILVVIVVAFHLVLFKLDFDYVFLTNSG